jgi:hypothetical protein
MSDGDGTAPGAASPLIYQIRVKGLLGPKWADWFGGLSIAPCANGDTVLTGPIADQAALFGVLKKLRDLGLPLLSLAPVPPGHTDAHPL